MERALSKKITNIGQHMFLRLALILMTITFVSCTSSAVKEGVTYSSTQVNKNPVPDETLALWPDRPLQEGNNDERKYSDIIRLTKVERPSMELYKSNSAKESALVAATMFLLTIKKEQTLQAG